MSYSFMKFLSRFIQEMEWVLISISMDNCYALQSYILLIYIQPARACFASFAVEPHAEQMV